MTKMMVLAATRQPKKRNRALYYNYTSRNVMGHVLLLVVMQLYEYNSEGNGMTLGSLFVVQTVLVEQLKELTGSLGGGDSVVALQVKLVECINLGSLLAQLSQSSLKQVSISVNKVVTDSVGSQECTYRTGVTWKSVP